MWNSGKRTEWKIRPGKERRKKCKKDKNIHLGCRWWKLAKSIANKRGFFRTLQIQKYFGTRETFLDLSVGKRGAPYHFDIINLGETAEENVDIHHGGRVCNIQEQITYHMLIYTRVAASAMHKYKGTYHMLTYSIVPPPICKNKKSYADIHHIDCLYSDSMHNFVRDINIIGDNAGIL